MNNPRNADVLVGSYPLHANEDVGAPRKPSEK